MSYASLLLILHDVVKMEGFPVVWLWSQGLAPCFKLTKREKTLSRDLLLFLIYYLVFTKYFTSETDVYTPTDQIRYQPHPLS